jgi:hypothetical protein
MTRLQRRIQKLESVTDTISRAEGFFRGDCRDYIHRSRSKQKQDNFAWFRHKSTTVRCGAGRVPRTFSQVRPLSLGLRSEVSADLLKAYFHLPAPDEPLQNLTWMLIELGAE